MNYFCTLFNQHYFSRGLTMLQSLERSTSSNYQLFILAMDELTRTALLELNLPRIVVISLSDFETKDLLEVKVARTTAEYCWTCTPAILLHCLEKYAIPECTYFDADLYFFNDPQILISEVKNSGKSILITPHNYTPHFDQSKYSGIYCVQFMYFKNDLSGLRVLHDWRAKCIEWCFHRLEDGKLGDQKYLDQWHLDFPGLVHDLIHLGAVAPWNVQKYRLKKMDKKWFLDYHGRVEELVFYHFHSLVILRHQEVFYGAYPISNSVRNVIYCAYERELILNDEFLIQKFKLPELIETRERLEGKRFFTIRYILRMGFWKIFYFWFKVKK